MDGMFGSTFLFFEVPNATTWFYLSLVLAVALFFKFSRPFSLRNLDLILLFLLVPPLLYLREAKAAHDQAERMAHKAPLMGLEAASMTALPGPSPAGGLVMAVSSAGWQSLDQRRQETAHQVWLAYLWLLIGTGYFFIRCLVDLALVRRPPFTSNLEVGGSVWLGLTLLLILSVENLMRPEPIDPFVQNAVVDKALAVGSWVRRSLAIACHGAVVFGLVWMGARVFQNLSTGVSAAVLYLLLPYTAIYLGELHHVLPAALLVGALATYRQPLTAGILLGLSAATAYFPLLLFPLWLGFYGRRGGGRFAVAFCGMIGLMGLALWLGGDLWDDLQSAMLLPDWQAWNLHAIPQAEGLWTGLQVHSAYRVPLFSGYIVLVLVTAFWPAPKNLAHLLALSAALIIGVQFWFADAGGIYVLWYLPLLVLVVLRPSLAERYPPLIDPATDWLARALRWTRRHFLKTPPQPVGSHR
jgi:hypothetical protein